MQYVCTSEYSSYNVYFLYYAFFSKSFDMAWPKIGDLPDDMTF